MRISGARNKKAAPETNPEPLRTKPVALPREGKIGVIVITSEKT
jgi:hypothetical protein